jgi:hypothetical protein
MAAPCAAVHDLVLAALNLHLARSWFSGGFRMTPLEVFGLIIYPGLIVALAWAAVFIHGRYMRRVRPHPPAE